MKRELLTATFVGIFAAPCLGATFLVPLDYPTIQEAIDLAADGDTVLVGPGDFIINESLDFMKKKITVRSENGPEETKIQMSGPISPSASTVVAFRGGDYTPASVLDGFTLTGGDGGGVYCTGGASPTVKNCTITLNSSFGVRCRGGSSPTLENCKITENTGFQGGGGGLVCESGSSPTVKDCVIAGNQSGTSGGVGGGVKCSTFSAPMFINCTITANVSNDSMWTSTMGHGGGMICESGSTPTLINCVISGNMAPGGGRGGDGGGIICRDGSPTLTNCIITENSARSGGGIRLVGNSSPILTNCTIAGNTGGGLISDGSSIPTLVNCIIWDNEGLAIDLAALPEVSYSCVEGDLPPGVGNINDDPLFAAAGDYHLQPGSPCIDKGTANGGPMTDFDGNPRPCGAGFDMGAYEHGCVQPPEVCGNGTDDDRNGLTDCDDPACQTTEACNCANGTDDDGNGLADCDDPACATAPNCEGVLFVRGDSDSNGKIELTDGIVTLTFLFIDSNTRPACFDAADTDDDGKLTITDGIRTFQWLFVDPAQLPFPPSPRPGLAVYEKQDCGKDPSSEDPELGCEVLATTCR